MDLTKKGKEWFSQVEEDILRAGRIGQFRIQTTLKADCEKGFQLTLDLK